MGSKGSVWPPSLLPCRGKEVVQSKRTRSGDRNDRKDTHSFYLYVPCKFKQGVKSLFIYLFKQK